MIYKKNNVRRIEISLKVAVLTFVDAVIGMNKIIVRLTGRAICIRSKLDKLALFLCDNPSYSNCPSIQNVTFQFDSCYGVLTRTDVLF